MQLSDGGGGTAESAAAELVQAVKDTLGAAIREGLRTYVSVKRATSVFGGSSVSGTVIELVVLPHDCDPFCRDSIGGDGDGSDGPTCEAAWRDDDN